MSALAQVQQQVRAALATAKGSNEGVDTQLDATLDLIVPEIERAALARARDLAGGLDGRELVRDADADAIQSALDWVAALPEAPTPRTSGQGHPAYRPQAVDALDMDAIHAEVKRRAAALPRERPALKVSVQRRTNGAAASWLSGRASMAGTADSTS